MMTLYNNPQSRGLTLFPLIQELGIEKQIQQVEVAYPDMHQPDYEQINPMGKVPCLVDQGVVISEMAAIYIYLADKFRDKGLAPDLDDPKRGAYLKWIFFCHGPLTEYIDISNLQIPAERIEQQRRSLSFGNETSVHRFLKQGIQETSPYLLGDQCTAADLYVAYCLIFAINAKILPDYEEFTPFLRTMAQRASLKNIAWFQPYRT